MLVPRGESEEETLVGSFTKLLVCSPASHIVRPNLLKDAHACYNLVVDAQA